MMAKRCLSFFSLKIKIVQWQVGSWESGVLPVDLLEALRLISVTMSRDTWVVNCSRSENFSIMLLGGAFPNT